jgi:heme-degrading monooxygenase HmoA
VAYVLVQHKIGKWKEFENIFRGDGERRRMMGSKGGKVFVNVDDPENVFVVFEWKDQKGAKQFAEGLETHEAMKWATSNMWSRVYVVDECFEVDA